MTNYSKLGYQIKREIMNFTQKKMFWFEKT